MLFDQRSFKRYPKIEETFRADSDRHAIYAYILILSSDLLEFVSTLNGCYGIPWVHYKGRQGDFYILVRYDLRFLYLDLLHSV